MLDLQVLLQTNGAWLRMRPETNSGNWFAFSLLADSKDEMSMTAFSRWAGYSSTPPHRETRVPRHVDPTTWWDMASRVHEPPIVVKDEESILGWLLLGGDGIVMEEIAKNSFPDWIVAEEVGAIAGQPGWVSTSGLPAGARRRVPSAKLRAEVLIRDRRKCRMCGRTPEDDVHVHLEVHHGVPFGGHRSGMTVEENLFTLCSTCHRGVTNGLEDQLARELTSSGTSKAGTNRGSYLEGVAAYRRWLTKTLKPTK